MAGCETTRPLTIARDGVRYQGCIGLLGEINIYVGIDS
jgi:hypothetical protein